MKRIYAVDANRVFLLSVIVSETMIYLIAGTGLRDRMALQFLMQLFLAFPAVAYLSLQRVSLKDGLRICPIGWREWLLLLPFAVCVNQIAAFINVVSQLFTVNTISNSMAELILQYPFPIAFFVIAVAPAICEELLFRGVLYRGYRKCGAWVAIILTAFLFGMMHMNPNQFLYAFALGILFALVNEITGSILPSVFLHLYINGYSVVTLYLWMNHGSEDRLQESLTMEHATVKEQIPELFPWTVLAVVGTVLILYLLLRYRGKKENRKVGFFKKEIIEPKEEKGGFRTVVSPTLIVGVLICIAYMVWR